MTQREVTLEGGVPWGFRMHGGVDLKTPLKISRVNPGSKAAQRGVREGDLITSINDDSTKNLTNDEAHNLLKKSGSILKLGLNEDIDDGSPKKRQYRTVHHETHQETVKRSSVTYTLNETIERSLPRRPRYNEFEAFKSSEFINGRDTKQNGRDITIVTNIPVSEKSTPSSSSTSTPSTLVPEGKNLSSDYAVASRQSSYSNCSSIPDEGSQQENRDHREDLDDQEMNDGQERMSKSKKRRQRRKNLLNRSVSRESQSQSEAEIDESDQETVTDNVEKRSQIFLEPSSKNLEILRLKRIEHKYKVESPKELKLDHVKSSVKKLKTKSKSLDDDDLLKIQELSEASESEDTKFHCNVVISEASSEENLLGDSDSETQRKRSALASIALQLNDDNQLEAVSHISPAEEQALRSFLGGLNLVNSPEESAKDLYERTTGQDDSKAKKQQKRKELEEYFVPIAQNPRYLDAISEEASDISDKECAGSSKSIHHIKQSTPEQDLGQNNLDVRPKSRADNFPKENGHNISDKPILVETRVLEPVQESICSTKIVPTGDQKVEVVFLVDSSESGDSDDAADAETSGDDGDKDLPKNTQSELPDAGCESIQKPADGPNSGSECKENLDATEKSDLGKGKMSDNCKPLALNIDASSSGSVLEHAHNNASHYDIHVGSQESISTILSSHTRTSTKMSKPTNDNVGTILMQLTPPPTPDGLFTTTDKNNISSVSMTSFDYTKIPNILKEKEPGSVGTEKITEKHREQKIQTNSQEDMDTKFENIEAKRMSALHTSKKTVNGRLESAEFRKVKVDEVSKNGDLEVTKDFEEYTTKQNENDVNEVIDKTVTTNKSEDFTKKTDFLDLNGNLDNVELRKEKINEVSDFEEHSIKNSMVIDKNVIDISGNKSEGNNKDIKKIDAVHSQGNKITKFENIEAKSLSTVHMSKKIVNGKLDDFEFRKVHVDEVSKNGDVEVSDKNMTYVSKDKSEDFDKNTDFLNLNVELRKEKINEVSGTDHVEVKTDFEEYSTKNSIVMDKNVKVMSGNKSEGDNKDIKKIDVHSRGNKTAKFENIEAKSLSAVHMSKKIVNGNLDDFEFRKVHVDEVSKNGDIEVTKDFEYTTRPNDNKTDEVLDKNMTYASKDKSKEENTGTEKIYSINENVTNLGTNGDLEHRQESVIENNKLLHENDIRKDQTVNESTSHSSTSESKVVKSSDSKSESLISESQRESVLRHVIMTSQDSNKTDSQKLLEFESIKKLNSELKDKINRQELIGPAFRKSKSPANEFAGLIENTHDSVIMQCEEELPGKAFVQKRVREFSQQNCDLGETMAYSNIVYNGHGNSELPSKECKNFIQSRIRSFSNGTNEDLIEKSQCEESILKRIILADDINNNNNNSKVEQVTKEIQVNIENKSKEEKESKEEKIPIKLDSEKEIVSTKEEGSILKRILECHTESQGNKCSEEKEKNLPNTLDQSNPKELFIPIELETVKETIIPIEVENSNRSFKPRVDAINNPTVENVISKNMEDSKKIIHIEIESANTKNNKDTPSSVQEEKIIPIQIESDLDTNKNVAKSTSNLSEVTKEDIKNISVSLRNIVENKGHNNQGVTTNIIKNKMQKTTVTPRAPLEKEIKNEPPIPPPRRSKALLLRKRQEAIEAESKKIKEPKIDEIPVSNDMTYTNVVSPPRPASASSDSSGSEDSSRCTAKYNPNSSIADVASIAKDEESCDSKQGYEPMSLRNIVLKVLMSLPFGDEILRELAEVSKTIEHFTSKLPVKEVKNTDNDNAILVNEKDASMPGRRYTQTDVARNSYEDERRKIVELHQKFLTRRKYNEGSDGPKTIIDDDRVTITGIGSRETQVMSPNRLLTIIREEPNDADQSKEFLYFEDNADQRLKAKNLGEWLTLARHKSKSTSNLDCTNIPINNLRRTITNIQNEPAKISNRRRYSLPQEIYEKQLIDIMEKEREIQRELEMLEEEKRKLRAEIAPSKQKEFQVDDFYVSKKGDFAEIKEDAGRKERPASMPVFPTEFFRQQMYEEYMDKFSERQERKQQKVIKISSSNDLEQEQEHLMKSKEIIHPIEIEQEFMDRVKEKFRKTHGGADENQFAATGIHNVATSKDSSSDDAAVIVLDGDKVKGVDTLPRHLQEFVGDLTTQQQDDDSIWSPGQPRRPPSPSKQYQRNDSQTSQKSQNDPVSPIWTPKSANSSPTLERKEFRPVSFQSPVLSRKNRTRSETIPTPDLTTSDPPWRLPEGSSDTALHLSSTLDRRLPTSQSTPGFGSSFATSSRLPKAQNPTITLLQKAREGQLPRGAHYIDQDRKPPNDRPPIKYPGEILYHIKNEYTSESDSERPKKMADLAPRKFEGIGPTTKDGMPLILRSEVKDKDQSKWYKRMYDTIHKQKPHRDEYVTIRYKQKRAQYPYTSGYLSEPEPGAYDSDFTEYKYQTLDRRRMPQTQHYMSNSSTMPRSVPDNRSYSSSDIIKNSHEKYNNQPGRIENYRPGHSSISEKEAKQHLEQQNRIPPPKPRSFINQALKESGYESDSTLVFKRKEETASKLNPIEQREAYKNIQKGGDVPFQGLRKLAPERPKETDLVEFFPISPTLTKIRIHKSIIPSKEFFVPEQEFFCYPSTVHHSSSKTFANFKRTAPSSVKIDTPPRIPTPPPSPPKRKSSRNNTTLRLISTMKVKTEKSPLCRRHETCFTSGPSVDRSKVNYLRDKITCKLSPVTKRKGDNPRLSVVKKISASPEMKSKITSTLTTSRDPKSSVRRVESSTKVSTDKLQTRGLYKSGSTGSIISKKSSTESLSSRTSTPVRTFGTEKRKFDLTLPGLNPKTRLPKTSSEELLSPTEVKKGIKNISASNTQYKESLALLSSAKLANETKALPIKVGITEKGKNILKSSIKRSSNLSPRVSRRATAQSPSPSTSSERSRLKSSTESLLSTHKSIRKSVLSTLKPKLKTDDKKPQQKSKKDQINDTLRQNAKKIVDTKCLSKATGADVAKKLDSSEITKQKQAIESNHFFRNLFFRNIKHSASFALPKNSWLIEKTNQLTRRRASISEPSIGAMKIYLKHTRPVSDSRFISLDVIRSRSTSPKSVTFSDNIGTEMSGATKRSKSLPSKMIFSQTSRPISPVITRRHRSPILKAQSKDNLVTMRRTPSPPNKLVFSQTSRPISPVISRKLRSPVVKQPNRDNLALVRRSPSPQTKLFFSETSRPISPEIRRRVRVESPPASPMLTRSPSCRKIMQIKQQTHEQTKPPELTLYTCPELKHSTTSLDSFRSEDYQVYLKDLTFGTDSSDKFKDLNHFYTDIEKVGELEQKFASKPRKKNESEIIDYDRWMEVRTREKAEHELKYLYNHLKVHEKEKGFLFLPKDIERYRWKRELDRGLRTKEKSVENIKEEFERIKREESDRERAKRREIDSNKDTYKPLWRGNSVVNLANILTEKRSQSEGRVKTARQKLLDSERLLTHGIGSRIWSSLSMEQVNNLKQQLQEIYGDDQSKEIVESPVKEYVVDVPKQGELTYIPQLTVRRNSESSKHELMSENEKKMISQTLSREVLEKISKRRKHDKLALPLVVGKEVLGAIATQEANVKAKKVEPEKPLIKTNALTIIKQCSVSETDSGSTDESTRTVINLKDVQKKVEYFEKAQELETYVPTVYKPAEEGSTHSEDAASPTEPNKTITEEEKKTHVHQSNSCQNLKEYFGESELVRFATLPLSATRKSDYIYTKKPHLRALDISPIRTISEANSVDSLNRSRSVSPYREEAKALAKKGEVNKLRRQFEFFEDFFGEKKLKRSRSENDLRAYGHVDDLRRKYEYPVHSGRGRSRVKRGGMVSPVWLRAEDRYMPHINIISKIASLYSFSKHRTDKEASKSMEELAEILGCPVGEVEKMKEKFDRMREQEEQISLMGHMYTSSPNLKELRDITPYLTANWIAHRYPRFEDNTRSLSSPETSIASRDTSLVRRDRYRPKSPSTFKKGQQHSILKQANERFETSSRYTKEPDLPPPPPPPKSQGGLRSQEQESPRKYVENEVTIHYKTPVRTEIKEYVSEDELAHRQAEVMKKIYEEERKRKYLQVSKSLQELQDMKSRRHTDNFIPSQKSPIPLNRYDDFDDLPPTKTRTRSPEPRLVAKALYNFVGQTARELTFRKGELIYVRRQVDKNWYEGELNAMVGLFPVNYVEIVPYEGTKAAPRKAHEGQARARYNFLAQTHLELSLAKGELVTVTRKVDDNWFEGKIGGRKGIFPVSYVDILIDPSEPPPPSTKPVASPASHSLLLNGSAQGKESMGSHLYTPNVPNPVMTRDNGYHHAKPVQLTGSGTYSTLPKTSNSPIDQALHIETQADPIPYRALYKYAPQNDDELELLEGDTVFVLEKCDDGWFVGSSDRTGAFGTFPGNYVEKI